MNPLDLYRTIQADELGRSQPRRQFRHLHLEPSPLAIAMVQMASEPFAIWGALVGTDRDAPILIVAPEPRNADIAFGALSEFAQLICEVVARAVEGPRELIHRKDRPPVERCESAPQLLVSNGAAIGLLDRLGRRMRPAGYKGYVEVPEEVNVAGAHLGFFAQMARKPGSSLVVPATDLLSRHWVTGQSSLEDDHLATQLAWRDPALLDEIDPEILDETSPAKLTGAEAASLAEDVPMGVLTDPEDDNGDLIDAVMAFNAARMGETDYKTVERLGRPVATLLEHRALGRIWRALWVAHDLASALPESESVSERWADDRREFTNHADYIADGGRVASLDSAKRAAMVLADWERAQGAVDAAEFVEDPMARADAIAAGDALAGKVTKVEGDRKVPNPNGGQDLHRPLVHLALESDCLMPVGTELWWTERPSGLRVVVEAIQLRKTKPPTVALCVEAGMQGDLPRAGDRAVFGPGTGGSFFRAPLPKDAPWTHTEADSQESTGDIDDSISLDSVLQLSGGGS